MTLPIGTRLGPFELTGSLGAGGMGEVYRALDTKLNREVALKVLPDHLLDPDRLMRFRREAQVVAALNHPNIAAIYGLEDSGEKPALVLELVEGPTLADRIAEGAVPVEEAVGIARQIADALETAHEQGIVHRDLKPANIKLRHDGTVKVLDFGLAKLTESGPSRSSVDPTLSPTMTAMTGVGVILGTAAYMAPEQAAGKQADKRADIWAFGVVLWEMLTGERLFASTESTSHVLADVLRAPIDFEKIPAGPLRDLLRRCLDRDVKTRLRDIGEARVVLSRPLESAVIPQKIETPGRARIAWAAAVLLAITTGVALWAPWRSEPDRPLARFDVDLGADVALPESASLPSVLVSPDGTRIAYIASGPGGLSRVYVRQLSREQTTVLAGTEGAVSLAFSADSRFLAVGKENNGYRVSVDGGTPIRITGNLQRNFLSWGSDGGILMWGVGTGLKRIPADGGDPVELTKLSANEEIHAFPHVLPGGRGILFGTGAGDTPVIEAISPSGKRKPVIANGTGPHYLASGHLLYLSQETLFAVRFDPDALATRGDPVPMVTDVKTSFQGAVAIGSFSISENGTLVYRKAGGTGAPASGRNMRVDVIDAKGARSSFIATPGDYRHLRFSPDGHQLAFTSRQGTSSNVHVYDRQRNGSTQITFDGGEEAAWVPPDGRYLLFRHGDGIYWTRPGGQPQRLLPFPAELAWSLTSDGKRFAYYMPGQADDRSKAPTTSLSGARVFTASLTEQGDVLKAGTPEPFSPTQFNEYEAEFSPNGKWIAFSTDKSAGRFEVLARAFPPPASGQAFPISTNGGSEPRWSRTSSELLYVEGRRLMAVKYVVKGDVFEAQQPHVRVEKFGTSEWDLAPDGRIAVVTPIDDSSKGAAPPPPADHTVVVIQNFADEVRRRVK
jgi:serine/threonine-protein kinase